MIINLDLSSDDVLQEWSEDKGAHWMIRYYARTQLKARKARFEGNISKATTLEEECDRLYEQLPLQMKW